MKKLENLLNFNDFNSNWKEEQSKTTKRTQTGLDILKEGIDDDGIEEIVPEGLPGLPENENDTIEEIKNFLDNEPNENAIEEIVNDLRDVLLEMEQMGFVEDDFTDELDDKHEGDWISWILEVIELPDFPEEGLNNIMEIINNVNADITYNTEDEDNGLDNDLDDDLDNLDDDNDLE